MPGNPIKRARREAKQREAMERMKTVAEGGNPFQGPEFEKKAVQALIDNEGDASLALQQLGVDTSGLSRVEMLNMAKKVIATPRVLKRYSEETLDLDKERTNIVSRMIRLALYSDNEDTSIRAATWCAKVGGWNAATKVDITGKTMSLHALITNENAMRDLLAQTSYEPGAAIPVPSEAVEERLALIATRAEEGVDDEDDDEYEDG